MKRRLPFDIDFLLESVLDTPVLVPPTRVDEIPKPVGEAESYQAPKLNVGDKILKGKFKNSSAEIKAITKDKHNHPILKTNKGNVQLFKPRIVKLMKEDPDDGFETVGDAEIGKARNQGWKLEAGEPGPWDENAVTFIIDEKTGQLVYSLVAEKSQGEAFHTHMYSTVQKYKSEIFKTGNADKYIIEDDTLGFGIVPDPKRAGKDVVWFLGVKSQDELKDTINKFKWPSGGNSRIAGGPSGRFWPEFHYISFWAPLNQAMKFKDKIFKFIGLFGEDPKKCAYEFIDKKKLYLYKNLDKSSNTSDYSPEEIKALQAKQHLDPDSKKKLRAIAQASGTEEKDLYKGFDFPAQRNAMMPALQEIVRKMIKEDPNKLNVTIGQAATLKSKGFDPKKMSNSYFDQEGTVTFIYDIEGKEMIYAESGDEGAMTHPEIGTQVMHFLHRPRLFDIQNASGGHGASISPSESADVGPGDTESTIYALNTKRAADLVRYLKDMEMPLHGDIPRNSSKFILGRFWPQNRAISFWRDKVHTMQHINEFSKLIAVYDMKPNDVVWEFIDIEHIFTYDELSSKTQIQTRSDAEQKELMAQQHLNPNAKKKLRAMDLANGMKDKNFHPGFDFPAQRDVMMPALQEIARRILRETPDAYTDTDTGKYGRWRDVDALTFITFPTFCLLSNGYGYTHQAIMASLKQCREENSTSALKSRGILCSNEKEMLKDLTVSGGALNGYFSGELNEGSDYRSSGADDNTDEEDGSDFRNMKDSLSGRLWTDKNVISFWNEQSKILKLWPQIQKMFKSFSTMLGDISNYKVDWIERSNDSDIKMTPASSITKPEAMDTNVPSTEENGQMNFIEKMFSSPDKLKSLSSEELKAAREKLHVLEPAVKNQFMKLLGQTSPGKIGQIADALGMTVAEFHSLTGLDELDTSKLRAMDLAQGMKDKNFHPGFDFPAQRDATMPALQEILAKVVKESPDYYNSEKNSVDWRQPGAVAFITFPTFCIIGSGFTHQGIMAALKKCKDSGSTRPLEETGAECSDGDALLKDLRNGTLKDYFDGPDNELEEGSDYTDKTNSYSPRVEFRDMQDSLSGRAWTKTNVISFWNKQSKVLKLWPQIQNMFSTFDAYFTELEDYNVDFLERRNDKDRPLTPASSIGSSGKEIKQKLPRTPKEDKSGQMNFINQMFDDPSSLKELSPDELKKIQAQLHVLNPEVKNQLLKLSGKFVNKASEIADALGMSVAEFNNLTRVDELNTSK